MFAAIRVSLLALNDMEIQNRNCENLSEAIHFNILLTQYSSIWVTFRVNRKLSFSSFKGRETYNLTGNRGEKELLEDSTNSFLSVSPPTNLSHSSCLQISFRHATTFLRRCILPDVSQEQTREEAVISCTQKLINLHDNLLQSSLPMTRIAEARKESSASILT